MFRFNLPVCLTLMAAVAAGCSLVPDVRHAPNYHNPFPQLTRVAVLPFFNQSEEPTLDADRVAAAYYGELQSIPGFVVRPVGATKLQWHEFLLRQNVSPDVPLPSSIFQQFAAYIDVDAVVVGAVTDYTPYYPPRIGMSVHWYAANPGFHPIPPGYGLPWGTEAEEHIPQWVVLESELEVARQQLATQTPELPPEAAGNVARAGGSEADAAGSPPAAMLVEGELPAAWPDPTGLIPDPPSRKRPPLRPQTAPVISHTRLYRGTDAELTEQLADYFERNDDARFGGWQSYLTRSEDFLRFCCHRHIAETLELRGGRDQSDLILRWPISRYQR